jgi:hypothetical protein
MVRLKTRRLVNIVFLLLFIPAFSKQVYVCCTSQLLAKLRALDEENTRLRNTVLEYNEEIFTLKTVVVSIEAEIKFETQQQLVHMESELKFKVRFQCLKISLGA